MESSNRREVTGEGHALVPEMPDSWNFPSAITHAPATFARLPSCLRTTTISLTHSLTIGCTFTFKDAVHCSPRKFLRSISQ